MRLCFHHLRPRLSRLEIEDRGMSSERRHGLPVERGPHGLLQAQGLAVDRRRIQALRRRLAPLVRQPGEPERHAGARHGQRAMEAAAVDLEGKLVFGVPLVELDLQAVILTGDAPASGARPAIATIAPARRTSRATPSGWPSTARASAVMTSGIRPSLRSGWP